MMSLKNKTEWVRKHHLEGLEYWTSKEKHD